MLCVCGMASREEADFLGEDFLLRKQLIADDRFQMKFKMDQLARTSCSCDIISLILVLLLSRMFGLMIFGRIF